MPIALTTRTLLCALLCLAAPRAGSQPSAAPSGDDGRITVRLAGGLTGLTLGEAGAFHQSVADAYVAAGVPVPTQRSYPAAPAAGLDVLWTQGRGRHFGVGVRHARTSAYSLYGDYAGTLDLVSEVAATFVETVSVVDLASGRRLRPYLGSRGGTVFATSRTEESVDLGDLGASDLTVGGRGIGYSIEGFGGVSSAVGPAALFAQAGYRYARVPKLDGEATANGQIGETGRLPYGLALSGWSVSAGVAVPLPF